MAPMIPTSPDDLPLEFETIPEDTQVRALVRDFKVAEKTDKKDNHYGVITWEVITPPEFEGRLLTDSYVGFQGLVEPNMTDAAIRRARERGIRFNRICACLKVRPEVVPCNPMDDVEEVNQFLNDEFVGQEGDFIVSVDEYKGRKNNKIKEYLLP